MLDIRFVRENPDLVKENIRKKFQNAKLPLVDEAIALDAERRQACALRVILQRCGRPEQRHNAVTGEFVHGAPVAVHDGRGSVE